MILAIRRKNIVISILIVAILAIGLFCYLGIYGKTVFRNLQNFIEDKIGQSLDAKVSMDSIQSNLIGPTVLNGLIVTKATAEDTPFIFKTDRVIIYNNIIKIALQKFFKKDKLLENTVAFKIENGRLYKGEALIFKNITGHGKIINNNLVFTDLNGKIYDFPLSIYGKISGATSKIDLDVISLSKKFYGKLHLSNSVLKPHAVAVVELNKGRKLYFSADMDIKPGESVSFDNFMFQNSVLGSGKLDFTKKRFYAQLKKKHLLGDGELPKNSVSVISDFSNKGSLDTSIFFDHISVGTSVLQSQLDINLVFTSQGIEGKLKTSGTILDSEPFKELDGDFSVKDGVLKVASLKWGDSYRLDGFADLYRPYQMDWSLNVKNGNLSQLFLVPDSEDDYKIKGIINGHINVKGSLDNLITVANIECGKGMLGNLDYESMNINLDGKGSVLKVADSRILRQDGYIELFGSLDLKRLWSSDPCKGLNWTCGNEAIVWNGWDIVKETNSKELEMKKGIGKEKEFMVTFKGYLNDEQSWQDSQGANQNEAVGVEYNLDSAKKLKMQVKNSEEIVSLENKVRF